MTAAPPTSTDRWRAVSAAAHPLVPEAAGQGMSWPQTDTMRATAAIPQSGIGMALPCSQRPADPVLALGGQTWRVANVISRHVQRLALHPVDLTWFEFQVLRYTCEHTVATTSSAATQFGVDAAEVMIASSKLHRRGLLYLSTARAEAGAVVAATARGHDVIDTVRQVVAAEERHLCGPWRLSDLCLIISVLNGTAAFSDAAHQPLPATGGMSRRRPITRTAGVEEMPRANDRRR